MHDDVLATTTTELRSFVDRLVLQLEADGMPGKIELREDLFWSVPSPALYDVAENPRELTIGSLADCLEFLRRDQGDDVPWMAVWLGQLLISIGHQGYPSGDVEKKDKK